MDEQKINHECFNYEINTLVHKYFNIMDILFKRSLTIHWYKLSRYRAVVHDTLVRYKLYRTNFVTKKGINLSRHGTKARCARNREEGIVDYVAQWRKTRTSAIRHGRRKSKRRVKSRSIRAVRSALLSMIGRPMPGHR